MFVLMAGSRQFIRPTPHAYEAVYPSHGNIGGRINGQYASRLTFPEVVDFKLSNVGMSIYT